MNSAFFLCRSTAYWVTGQWYHTRGATQLPTLAPSRAAIHLEEEAGIPLLRRRRRESGRGAAQGACVAVRQWSAAQGAGADPEQRARAGLHPRWFLFLSSGFRFCFTLQPVFPIRALLRDTLAPLCLIWATSSGRLPGSRQIISRYCKHLLTFSQLWGRPIKFNDLWNKSRNS